mmetsp:Transcript_2008/g.4892  ORF Transcript_2008/g.4892 Transcript_2008/m.4892 type:complete len:2244 (+) Transcript_2008:137-6868(+)
MLRGFGRPKAPSLAPPPPFASHGGSASSSSSSAVVKTRTHDGYGMSRSAPSLERPTTQSRPSGLGALAPSTEVSPMSSARGPRASDLDFAMLCSHVLVMQRPWKLPTNLDIPRNNVGDVAEFLNGNLDRRYQVFSIDGRVSGHTASRADSLSGFAEFNDQALLFRSSDSHHVKQPPPPLSLLCSFCSSVLFWLNLDRSRNVCVLQIGEHASAAVLLFFAALLLALEMVPPSSAELLRHLEAVCRADGPPRKKASTIRWIDHTGWAPSLHRYLGYVESLCKHGRRLKYVKPPRLIVMLIDVKRFARGSDQGDIKVEVYAGAFNEETVTTELRLVVDESSYQVMHSAPNDGALLLEMSPNGRAPLWVQGDVAVVVKLASRPHVCCRYFFHTDFVVPGESDYLLLTKADLDIDRDTAEFIPEDVMVGIALSDRAPSAGTEQPLQETMPQVLALPNARPVGDKLEFSRYHVVAPEACLLKELVEGGFAKADVVVALQVTKNSFVDSIDFLSRYFPMSSQAGASRLASWALFAQPQAGQSPPDSEQALSESTTDLTTREAEVTIPTTASTSSSVQVAVKMPEPRVENTSTNRSFWPWFARKQATAAAPAATTAERKSPRPAQPMPAGSASSRGTPSPQVTNIVTGAPTAPLEVQQVQPQQFEARATQPGLIADRMTVHDAHLSLPRQAALKSLPKARGASRKNTRRPMSSRTAGKVDNSVQQIFAKGGGPLGGPWPSPMPAPPVPFEDTAAGLPSVDGEAPVRGCQAIDEAMALTTPATPSGANPADSFNVLADAGSSGTPSSAGTRRLLASLKSGGSASEVDAKAEVSRPSTPSNTVHPKLPEQGSEVAPTPDAPPPKAAKAKGRGKGPLAPPPKSIGVGPTAAGPAANCNEEPEVEPPNNEGGVHKEAETPAEAETTAKVAPPAPGKGKVGPPPKGKGKGGPPPPPGAKAAAGPPAPASEEAPAAPGKSGPPPPKGKGVAPKGKAKAGFAAKAKAGLGAKSASPAVLPLGRKLHWKPIAERNLENTVWEEINAEDGLSEPSAARTAPNASPLSRGGLRVEILERLFKNGVKDTTSAKAKAGARRKAATDQITILDNKRAQNVAIILCGLGFDPAELCDRLKTLNTDSLSIDSLEKCRDILPTEDEVERLVAYRGEISALRDVEKRLHPLAFMSRLVQRLKLMTFNMQLPHLARDLESDISKLVQATKQVRESKQLKKVLRVVLILGNFVNYGTTDEKAKQTKGFSIEALPKLTEMKSPVHSSITMLHYVAYRILGPPDLTPGGKQTGVSTDEGADQRELRLLQEELSLVGEASRVAPNNVSKQLEALGQETNTVAQELKFSSKYEPEAIEAMRKLQVRAEARLDELTAAFSECERQSLDLLHFFGEDPRHRSVNALLATLQEFIDSFAGAARDLRKQPKKFELLLQPTPPLAADGSAEGSSSAAASVNAGRRFTVAGANSYLAAAAAVAAAGSDAGSVLPVVGEESSDRKLTEVGGELPPQARRTCPPGKLMADLEFLHKAGVDKLSETRTCPSPVGEANTKNSTTPTSARDGKMGHSKGKGNGPPPPPTPPPTSSGKSPSKLAGLGGEPVAGKDGSESAAVPNDTKSSSDGGLAVEEPGAGTAQSVAAHPEVGKGKVEGKGKRKGPPLPGAPDEEGLSPGPECAAGANQDDSGPCSAPSESVPSLGDATTVPDQEQGCAHSLTTPPEASVESPGALAPAHSGQSSQGKGKCSRPPPSGGKGPSKSSALGSESGACKDYSEKRTVSDDDIPSPHGSTPVADQEKGVSRSVAAFPKAEALNLAAPSSPPAGDANQCNGSFAVAAASVDAGRRFKFADANSSFAAAEDIAAAGGDEGSVLMVRVEASPGRELAEVGGSLPSQARRTCPPGKPLAHVDLLQSTDPVKIIDMNTRPCLLGEADANSEATQTSAHDGEAGQGKGTDEGPPLLASDREGLSKSPGMIGEAGTSREDSSRCVLQGDTIPAMSGSFSVAEPDDLGQSSTFQPTLSQVGEVSRPLGSIPPPAEEASSSTCYQPFASSIGACQPEVARSAETAIGHGVVDQGGKAGPSFFALDDQEDSDIDDDIPLKRQNSLDERYDAFEAMTRASLAGEIKRQSVTDAGAGGQSVQAFSLEGDDLVEECDDAPTGQLRRSASFDWQYDALDAGNAIAAVAAAGDASAPCDVSSPTFYCDCSRNLLASEPAQNFHSVPALPGSGLERPGDGDDQQECVREDAPSSLTAAQELTGAM